MLNLDAYRVARENIKKKLDIPQYFYDNIDKKVNLEAQTLVRCPLHDETTPSFKYFSDTETFFCFGCERGGTVIELHYFLVRRSNEKYSKARAVIDLSKDYGIEIPNIFDESFRDEENLFKYTPASISRDKKYPVPWILKELEKKLEIIKKEDFNRYVSLCNSIDNIYLVGVETQSRLLNILESL